METANPKTRRRKRKIQTGEVFEIRQGGGKIGFARAVANDRIGWLFEFFPVPIATPDSVDQILSSGRLFCAHINEYSIRENWVKVGNAAEGNYSLPTMFNGHPAFFWEITEQGVTRTVDAKSITFDELVDLGYVSRTLWIAARVEECLVEGCVPRFPVFSKQKDP